MIEVIDIATGRVIATYSDAHKVNRVVTADSRSERNAAEITRARTFLRRIIQERGVIVAETIHTLADEHDISIGTLRRAKSAECIESARVGWGRDAYIIWRYPS